MAAPSRPAANSDSRNAGLFGPSHATLSPLATPSVRSPLASRRPRSASSEYVSERSPATRATPSGAALARRSIHEPTPAFPTAVGAVMSNPRSRHCYRSRRGQAVTSAPPPLPAVRATPRSSNGQARLCLRSTGEAFPAAAVPFPAPRFLELDQPVLIRIRGMRLGGERL